MNLVTRLFSVLAPATLLFSSVHAATHLFDLSPADLAPNGILNAASTGGEALPIGLLDAPIGWENGSFVSNLDGVTNKYTQLYVNLPLALGVPSIRFEDLAGITYFTKQGTLNPLDWTLRIYTKPEAGDTSFYRYRFDGANPTGNTEWALSDANSPGWFVGVNNRANGGNVTTGISQTLTELTGSYSGDLLYFSLFTGASGNTSALANGLDGLVVTMKNGDEVRINMVPEPGTVSLLALGGAFLLKRTRRKNAAFAR